MATPTIPNGEEYFFPLIYEGNSAGQRVGKFVPFTDNGTIANSVLFNDDDDAYLARTFSTPTNNKKWTYSVWIKRGALGTDQAIMSADYDGASYWDMRFNTSNQIYIQNRIGSSNILLANTTRTFEDTSKWYHLVFVYDSDNSTSTSRAILYIDGDIQTLSAYPSSGDASAYNVNSEPHHIGVSRTNSTSGAIWSEFDGYFAEANFVDGQALTPASFGLTDTSTGRWIPKTVSPYPTTTTSIAVTVVDSGGNKYALDGVTQGTVTLIEGATYRFDQSDGSNSGHPLRFSTTSNGTHGGGTEFTSGVTTAGTPGSSGAYTEITVPTGTATLYYYCTNHSGMGGTANTQDQYGTNGFRLKFQDSSALGDDTSGNTNDFSVTNIVAGDQTTDSPTQNHATIDPNTASNGSMTFAEGNLNVEMNNAYPGNVLGTLGASSGKYYWEVTISGTGSSANGYATGVGVAEWSKLNTDPQSVSTPFSSFIDSRSIFVHNGASVSNSTTFTAGDVISIALNLDDSEISYFKNNTIVGSAQPLVEGQTYFPLFKNSTGVADLRYTPNFGQKSWNYTPPTGFVALQQDNLPETAKGISGFTWIKDRDNALNHNTYDSSNGVFNRLVTNNTSAILNTQGGVSKFLKGGIVVGDTSNVNNSGASMVSWNWVANSGTTSTNTDGSFTSTVQANTTAGFSIVQFTPGSSAGTVGHGLSQAPEWIIMKDTSRSVLWLIYHKDVGADKYLQFTNAAPTSNSTVFSTEPTATTFDPGTGYTSGSSYGATVTYCWHSVDGFSKFGKYVGNGNADGPFVYTGFKPVWVLFKSNNTANWYLHDSTRSPNNPIEDLLYPNLALAENNNSVNGGVDFLSNGFKIRQPTGYGYNYSGTDTYYMAFAEHPFVGDGTSPVTAR